MTKRRSRIPLVSLVVAAAVLIAVTMFVVPGVQPVRKSARSSGPAADKQPVMLGDAIAESEQLRTGRRRTELQSPGAQQAQYKRNVPDAPHESDLAAQTKDGPQADSESLSSKSLSASGNSANPPNSIRTRNQPDRLGVGSAGIAETQVLDEAKAAPSSKPTPYYFEGDVGILPKMKTERAASSQQSSIGRPQLLSRGKQAERGYRRIAPNAPSIDQWGLINDAYAEGQGPGKGGDKYTRIYENPFLAVNAENKFSTFSIDVDTASYANVRHFLMQSRALPPPDAVRIEEMINYFNYQYAGPESENEAPFASHVEVAGCPWQPEHRLVRIGIKGRDMEREKRPLSNLVFLIDVSGSMNDPNKLPLVVEGMKSLVGELGENDRVAVVVYASSEGLVLPSTPGTEQKVILSALDRLRAGGSTAGGAGIQLAYQIAEDHFIQGGVNRVILCTDGDFNVGVTSTADLERMVEKKAKDTGVFLSVLGFGRGNLNDAMMEVISNRGNGNYHYVDNSREARKVLVEELTGTLVTIAKDVKIQIEFNPAQVAAYRLIGYENRVMATEDFNDDKKDAGEIGAGHMVTALYEIVPAGSEVDMPDVDESRYQKPTAVNKDDATSGELLFLKMRFKRPDGQTSSKLEWAITDDDKSFGTASGDFKFATAVAGFGMLLRESKYKGSATWDALLEIAGEAVGEDPHGRRAELLELIRRAKQLSGG